MPRQFSQAGRKFRELTLYLFDQVSRTPREDAGVPQIAACFQVGAGPFHVGLFDKPIQPVDGPLAVFRALVADLEIAVTGFGTGRVHAEGQQTSVAANIFRTGREG